MKLILLDFIYLSLKLAFINVHLYLFFCKNLGVLFL